MATQAPAVQRTTRRSAPPPRPAPGTHPQRYRRRRPESSTLHRVVREHLETYLALAHEADPPLPLPTPPTAPATQPEGAKPRAPNTASSRPSKWAALLARMYQVFPLICPTCQTPLTFIAFLTDPEPITQILAHISEPIPEDNFDQTWDA